MSGRGPALPGRSSPHRPPPGGPSAEASPPDRPPPDRSSSGASTAGGTADRLRAAVDRGVPGIRLLPVVHDRIEMGGLVHRVLELLDPAAVAVELPATLADPVRRAVARLPEVSLVVSREPGQEALVWAAVPGDPFAEALRWAAERGRPTFFVDPDLPYAERHADPVPDPYALHELGPEGYLEPLAGVLAEAPASEADRARERGMAHRLREAAASLGLGGEAEDAPAGSGERGPGGSRAERRRRGDGVTDPPATDAGGTFLLALLGAAHVERVARDLTGPTAIPLARTRRADVELVHLHPESFTALLPDPPLAHAVYELARRSEVPEEPPPVAATLPRRLSLVRHGLTLLGRGEDEWSGERRLRLAEHAAWASLPEVSRDPDEASAPLPLLGPAPDRHRLGRVVWEVGALSWREVTREEAAPWQRRIFHDFARRYARVEGLLVPGLFEWVVAARGVGDDNLAWEVFEVARSYPFQAEAAAERDLPTARVDGDELDLGTRRVRFRRRFFRVKRRMRRVPVRERPATDPEELLEGFTGGTLCSWPPEDLVIEDWGRYLRARAEGLLAAERRWTEPFTASLLDGIDLRETLRHLADDGRVRVSERGRLPGRAGSVVVIFDRDRPEDRGGGGGASAYPYLMTWLGEHEDESDMAFYSTHPAEQVVGPGILRATYGGFLMTVPPGRLAEVWTDPDYRQARDKGETLLLAGIDYSEDPLVVHVAAEAPSELARRWAAVQGKRLVHVPIASLSPGTLRKIRVLHILVGRDKRAIAKRYIW